MKKIIMLSIIALSAGTAGLSLCAPITKTIKIPGATPSTFVSKSFDMATEKDAISQNTIQEAAQEKINDHKMPFILAVVDVGSKDHYYYYEAESIAGLHNATPGMKAGIYDMLETTTRKHINHVYYYTLDKLTGDFTYLCSDEAIFGGKGAGAKAYQDFLQANEQNNNAKSNAAKAQFPKALGSSEKRFGLPGSHEFEQVNITSKDPVTALQLQVAMNKKTKDSIPYVLAVVITIDASGNPALHYYDPASIAELYQKSPGRSANNQYKMREKTSGLAVHEVYYYTLNKLGDSDLNFLCTGTEVLEGSSQLTRSAGLTAAYKKLVNATTKTESDDALATIKKLHP